MTETLSILSPGSSVQTPLGDGVVVAVMADISPSRKTVHYRVRYEACQMVNPAFRGRPYEKWHNAMEVKKT